MHDKIYFCAWIAKNQYRTSILKVLLKQYKSPTGPTNFLEAKLLQKQIKAAQKWNLIYIMSIQIHQVIIL